MAVTFLMTLFVLQIAIFHDYIYKVLSNHTS